MCSFLLTSLLRLLLLLLSFPSLLLAGKEGRNKQPQTPPVSCIKSADNHNPPLLLNKSPQKELRDGRSSSSSNDDLSILGGSFSFATNCHAKPPKGSSYEGFTTMQEALLAAVHDAVALAQAAESLPATSVAFTHYFKGDPQHANFVAMMRKIGDQSDAYTVEFDCASGKPCGPQSIAVTDATVGEPSTRKTIQICNTYWKSGATRYLLPGTSTSPDPPYRSKQEWCTSKPTGGANYYATAGHSLLHEFTHLDTLGKQAGLSPDGDGRHGTGDFQKGCELNGARTQLDSWVKDTKGVLASPDYNAESYAATATGKGILLLVVAPAVGNG
ncbi:hypothetical protein GP486_006132 [Trichoglossum hirsutum]|uniref:Uncharacterized protein n=1 Tax=Trichoglossum hirsutum TaxID=265104 RepID=A0A9P8L7X5_9PEZI|nr:hypothetical protein GP486_006132 [Trichoglossum hirsutum]